jgi:hypothetical protein
MTRTPSRPDQIFGWYWSAIAGAPQQLSENDPQCGWYKMRLCNRGPWVPVAITLDREIDEETGELLSPEVIRCTVDGDAKDPIDVWSWCCTRPIAEHEFNYLTALRQWQRIHEPHLWDPYKPVDMTETPIEE